MDRRVATVTELLHRPNPMTTRKEEDMVRGREQHVKKTKKDQDATLKRYVLWHLAEIQQDFTEQRLPLPDEDLARDDCLRPNINAPNLAAGKDFLGFYIATSQPVLTKKPTINSINTVAEWSLPVLLGLLGSQGRRRTLIEETKYII